ncbi:hypothetical protein MAJHIDBO_01676 [Propionibacterium freudenreichii subsp. shermanii]|nr:hypothetical protein MAJHIDBO_01676 [Propionibacterium freudenreichii subsp. shermanii]SPS09465.1 hypothetical protein MAJHIDBO_01676 [Propionibacterium freudenreichii subsp. shermanii]
MRSASSATLVSAPALSAARSPTRMMVWSSSSPAAASLSSSAASVPGAVGHSRAPIFSEPRVAKGANDTTCSLFLRHALRRRKKTIGDSSSGSKLTSTTLVAFSRASKVTESASLRPTTWLVRKVASSALAARERKSMSLLPTTARAKRL